MNLTKGTVTYQMELGGLWLVRSVESDLGGQKFYGKSLGLLPQTEKVHALSWATSFLSSHTHRFDRPNQRLLQ